MRGCILFALVAAALQTSGATDDVNGTYPPDLPVADEWPEKLFMPGFRAEYMRQQSEVLSRKTEPPRLFVEINRGENSTGDYKNLKVVLYGSPLVDEEGPFLPAGSLRSPWTYAVAFCLGSVFAIAFVALNVVRYRRSRKSAYDKVDVAEAEDPPPGPPSAAEEADAKETTDLEAERLLLQPLLESGVSPANTKREARRLARSLQEDRLDGGQNALRSLWDKIARSSRELFVPDPVSGSAGRRRSSGGTVSTLPTVASRVDSLAELTDVEKTLWWRTM